MEASDRALITRWKQGDNDAFDLFYKRHCTRIFFYLLTMVGRREIAEELLQETFVKLLGAVDGPAERRSLGPYLASIARNLATDRLRRARREKRMIHTLQNERLFQRDRNHSPLTADEAAELLWKLSDSQREAVVLKIYAGFTFADISQITDVPLNTAASRYRYGIARLKDMLNGELS